MDDFQERFNEARSVLDRFEQMVRVAGKKWAPDEVDAQYAYMTGVLFSEIRMLAYRYPEVVEDLKRTAHSMEKQYVVDVLSTDAKV